MHEITDAVKGPSEATGPSTSFSHRLPRFLVVLLQLFLIAAVVSLFEIERGRHFFPVLCFLIGGFTVHTWLPLTYRLTFFAALSAASVLFILGITNGLCVLGIGSLLIGLCYLPIQRGLRLVLMLATVTVLFLMRSWHPYPFWPVVGSMFMFRMMCLLHETKRAGAPPSLSSSIAYFVLLPNACFPFFPVVDFRVFRETWYQSDEWDTCQRGIGWILRGIIHLLLYRYIKLYVVPKPYELYDITHVSLFMAANYALYLQVSGQFHLIAGLLHLFGFNLPRTHNWFFLASSFSDIWRRINIYWKDFMTKYFFFPAFYALRQRNASAPLAMTISTLFVFVCTWLLHSWQTFWLLGRFPLTVNDACLWLGAGVIVAVNVLIDARSTRPQDLSRWTNALWLTSKTVGMFVLISLFWACWTKPGFLDLIVSAMKVPSASREIFRIASVLIAFVLVGAAVRLVYEHQRKKGPVLPDMDFWTSSRLSLAALGLMATIALPNTAGLFPASMATTISQLQVDPAYQDSAEDRLQSYYEDLNSAVIQAGPLLKTFSPPDTRVREQALGFAKVSRPADAYQQLELIPGLETVIDGHTYSINPFGMRDRRSITKVKPPGTIRIALVGSSIVMGYGVSDDEVFARQLETRLNRELAHSPQRVQVLNFGVGKQWAPHRLIRIQRKVVEFQPDVLFYFAHQDEYRELAAHTAQLIAARKELPSRHLKEVATRASVSADMAPGAIQSALQRYETDLLVATYRTIVDECQSHHILPVWIYLPIPGASAEDLSSKLIPIASDAGFMVHNLSHWAKSPNGLFDSMEEFHPNGEGHRLIAEALMRMVNDDPRTVPGWPGEGVNRGLEP